MRVGNVELTYLSSHSFGRSGLLNHCWERWPRRGCHPPSIHCLLQGAQTPRDLLELSLKPLPSWWTRTKLNSREHMRDCHLGSVPMHSPSVGEDGEPAQAGHKQLGTGAYYSACIYGDLLNMCLRQYPYMEWEER